ncbi:hypothetical protein [Gordonia alkanivorans]|uniref:hypothetical protein n=1 Tax=Gordonia alkanivorans TaxID=84096 RepID=UPI001E4D7CCC|nr:hypothetical protein [Gordonia alkanivorans]
MVIAALVGTVTVALFAGKREAQPSTAQPAATDVASQTPPAREPEPSCPARVDNESGTIGNGTGDQKSGAGVILAFNHAYYTLRDARAAAAVAVPNALSPRPELQGAIDKVADGSQYCMTITESAPNLYRVINTVTPPTSGQPGIGATNEPQPVVYRQVIQTVESGGRTWIVSIRKDS